MVEFGLEFSDTSIPYNCPHIGIDVVFRRLIYSDVNIWLILKHTLVFYLRTNHKLVMDLRNNPHVSLFSFSRSFPLLPLPQNCFLRRVSLTHFPSRSPIRGYLNLLTAGLYPRAIDYRFVHADDSPRTAHTLSLPRKPATVI